MKSFKKAKWLLIGLFLIKSVHAEARTNDCARYTPILEDSITSQIRSLVDQQLRSVVFQKGVKPDLARLEKEAVQKYGEAGEVVMWDLAALYHYLNTSDDISTWFKLKEKINKKYPDYTGSFILNNDAWHLFTHVNDRKMLETAISWIQKVVEKEPTANHYDTYANLLYKLGRKAEAIRTMEKGLSLNPGDGDLEEIRQNYEKMKRGEKTWKE